jgi:hypothetical protein
VYIPLDAAWAVAIPKLEVCPVFIARVFARKYVVDGRSGLECCRRGPWVSASSSNERTNGRLACIVASATNDCGLEFLA